MDSSRAKAFCDLTGREAESCKSIYDVTVAETSAQRSIAVAVPVSSWPGPHAMPRDIGCVCVCICVVCVEKGGKTLTRPLVSFLLLP